MQSDLERVEASLRRLQRASAVLMIVPVFLGIALVLLRQSPDDRAWALMALYFICTWTALTVGPLSRALMVRRRARHHVGLAAVAFIVPVALAAVPALLGFLMCRLGAPLWFYAVSFGLSALGYALNFPTRARFAKLLLLTGAGESAGGDGDMVAENAGLLGAVEGLADPLHRSDLEAGADFVFRRTRMMALASLAFASLVSYSAYVTLVRPPRPVPEPIDAPGLALNVVLLFVEFACALYMPSIARMGWRQGGLRRVHPAAVPRMVAMAGGSRMAICAVPAASGLMLASLGASWVFVAIGPVLSAIAFIMCFPRRAEIEEWYDAAVLSVTPEPVRSA